MVDISRETPQDTRRRLHGVLRRAELDVLDGLWRFRESPLHSPPALSPDVLAVVRDDETWSWLAPETDADAGDSGGERFGLWTFHFPDRTDNSGFVGWLATELKHRLGTGVFVVCGSNSSRGGIYDHWGCPAEVLPEAVAAVRELARTDGP